jgi:hypothetical protein
MTSTLRTEMTTQLLSGRCGIISTSPGTFASNEVADGVGFEPTVRLPARRFSRPVP